MTEDSKPDNFTYLRTGLSQLLIGERKRRGLTVREFARLCDVPPSTISRIEVHGDPPKTETFLKIAEVCNVSPYRLLSLCYPGLNLGDLAVLICAYEALDSDRRASLLSAANRLVSDAAQEETKK